MNQELTQSPVADETEIPSQLSYTLERSVEVVGVGLVPTGRARPLVLPPFELPDPGAPVTPLVVLAVKSEAIIVDGNPARAGALVQVGLVIAPPDGSGDMNTLSLWHYTSSFKLAQGLRGLGLNSQYVPWLGFDLSFDGTDGSASVRVRRPAHPELALAGKLDAPSLSSSFVANWWAGSERSLVKLTTAVQDGSIGEALLRLDTDEESPLGRLIGGGSISFALVQRFNSFPKAHTEVRVGGADKER